MLLAALEARRGKPAGEIYHLIAGTSTGGIIAAGLAAGVPAKRIVDLYVNDGPAIFERRWWRRLRPLGLSKYSALALEARLAEVFGSKRLASVRKCELLIPTYVTSLPWALDIDGDGTKERASSIFFKSWKARRNVVWDFLLKDVCRATSAAPTYFPAARIPNVLGDRFTCIDGGVFANNPALCALSAAHQLWPNEEIQMVSIGTGTRVKPIFAGDWGYGRWLPVIFSAFMDGSADTASYVLRDLMGRGFTRCDVALPNWVEGAFDCATVDNIRALSEFGVEFSEKFVGAL